MSQPSETSPALDQWAGLLACPACQDALAAEEGRMVCTGCGRAYPVVDGIPVLIAERAEAAGNTAKK
jgi:uncharacterized protein